MATKIYTKTGDKGTTSLIGGTKVSKSNLRIEAYGTVDELNSFIGLLTDQLALAAISGPSTASSSSEPSSPSAPSTTSASSEPPSPSAPSTASASSELPSPSASASSAPATNPASPGPTSTQSASSAGSEPVAASELFFPGAANLLREIQDRLFTIGSSLACDPDKEPKLKIPDLKEEDITLLELSIDTMEAGLPPMRSFLLPGGHPVVSTAHIARCVCRRAERCCVRLQDEQLFVEPLVLRYLNRLSDWLFVLARYLGHRLAVPEIPWKPRV